jgi:penicillin-binding protein 2
MLLPAAPRNCLSFNAAPRSPRVLSPASRFAMLLRATTFAVALSLAAGSALAITETVSTVHHKKKKKAASATAVSAKPHAATASASPLVSTTIVGTSAKRTAHKPRGVAQTWDEPTYKDSIANDKVDGEDITVRKAAVEALGPLNGSVVAVDPSTGRILTIVNQPLALGAGFQPCSTVKVSVALAALREGIVARSSPVRFYGRHPMDLTDAIAHSNNYYFANLGIKLGYERMNYYAHLFGYGEKAGLNVEGEQPGYFPPAPPKNGGMGMLTSFGEEISQTPLELAALIGAIANGGTLYWMQYPRSQEEATNFEPQVKRHLDIANLIDDIKPGMRGAVDFGTARRAKQDDVILGKTGTCSEGRTHLGWFGSFIDDGGRKMVVVVMLTGGRISIGATAAEVAGDVYRRLASENFFKTNLPLTPAALLTPQICCRR